MKNELSKKLFEKAAQHIPGGVNSPVRAFKSVGGVPPFIVRAKGARVIDADGNEYIDYVGSWGPAILGHADPRVLNELNQQMKNGLSFGAPTPGEIELAALVKEIVPSIELIRFVNSGTEATMSAIRVARGFTGKAGVVKFDGCYHGHADYLLVKAGSGAQTLNQPDSAGIPHDFVKHTHIARYNDIASVETIVKNNPDIACVIIEPVIGNMGCIKPQAQFLKDLREVCTKHNIILIFDEVMTGFRVQLGGAQALYGIKPDLTCFGKIIGGGLPVGAYGGRKDIMSRVAPLGPVYQAGTLSGNPLAMTAGIITLKLLRETRAHDILEKRGAQLEVGLDNVAQVRDIPLMINRVGSLFSFYFTENPVNNADDARAANSEIFVKVFHALLERGVYLAPSAFEAGFISVAHTEADINDTIKAFDQALQAVA